MMTIVPVGSFSLRDLNHGGLSGVHFLSAITLLSMIFAVVMIRKGRRRAHYFAMIGCFVGAVVAGLFTLHPDRLIGGFFFGA